MAGNAEVLVVTALAELRVGLCLFWVSRAELFGMRHGRSVTAITSTLAVASIARLAVHLCLNGVNLEPTILMGPGLFLLVALLAEVGIVALRAGSAGLRNLASVSAQPCGILM